MMPVCSDRSGRYMPGLDLMTSHLAVIGPSPIASHHRGNQCLQVSTGIYGWVWLLSVLTTSASTCVDVDVDVGSHYSCSMCEMCEIARDHPDLAKRVRSLRVWCQMPYDQNALRDLLGDLLPRLRRIVLTRVCTNPPAFALADSRVHLECPRMFMGGLDDSDMQTITRVGALGSRTVDTLCVWAHFTPGVVDELKNASAAGLRAREVAITWYNRGTFQATSPPDEWVPVVNVAIKSLSLSQNGFSH